MKYWLCTVLLLSISPLFAREKKFGGYVMDPAAFRNIQTYCVDTHNLPPRQVKVIDRFVSHESRPNGLLAKLPWRRLETCEAGDPDAIVRLEFPDQHVPFLVMRRDVKGALLVFRTGSPSPIYETPAVLMAEGSVGGHNSYQGEFVESDALDFVVRILIHDWQQL